MAASVEARNSLIIYEFSSCLFADSAMNLVSDSSNVCLRSGYEEFPLLRCFSGNGTFRVKDLFSGNIEPIIKQDYFLHINQIVLGTFHQELLKSFPSSKEAFVMFLLKVVNLLYFLCSASSDLRLQLRTWEKLEALLDLESPMEYEIISSSECSLMSKNKSSFGELDSTRPGVSEILFFERDTLSRFSKGMINTPYSINLNTPYGSAEGQYAVLTLQNMPYCLEEQIRCLDCRDQYVVLSGRVDTSYPTGGYGVSLDLSQQDT
ncbi:hypothetical protein Tco_0664709 [Tanacetum coccineum]